MRSFYTVSILILLAFSSCKKTTSVIEISSSVFVANQNSENISVIDAKTNKIKSCISVSVSTNEIMMPHNVQVSSDGRMIWSTVNAMDFTVPDQVIVIDPLSDQIVHRINIGKAVHVAHVVLDDDNRYAYTTATDSNMVVQINARTYQVEKRIYLGSGHKPHGLRYFNDRLYVANMMSGTASVIDLKSGAVTDIPIGGMSMQTAISPNGRFAYFSLYDMNAIAICNVETEMVEQMDLPEAKGPVQISLTPDGKKLFICDQGLLGNSASDKVFVFDTQSKTIIRTITTGKGAHGVCIDPTGRMAYITNSTANTVSVIDVKNLAVTCNIPVGTLSAGITYWSSYAF